MNVAPAIPADLRLNEVVGVSIYKLQGFIAVFWKRDGLLFCHKNDYNKLIATVSRLKQQILKRPNKNHRIELWECVNEHGVYDWDVEKKLMKIRGIDFLNHNYDEY